MKKTVGIISVFLCVALICVLGVSMSSDASSEAAFRLDLERRIDETVQSFPESYAERWAQDNLYLLDTLNPIREVRCVISDEMVAGYALYDGHFFLDWETNLVDETELMAVRLEIARTSAYYNEALEAYNHSEKTLEDFLRLKALREILGDLNDREVAALPDFS